MNSCSWWKSHLWGLNSNMVFSRKACWGLLDDAFSVEAWPKRGVGEVSPMGAFKSSKYTGDVVHVRGLLCNWNTFLVLFPLSFLPHHNASLCVYSTIHCFPVMPSHWGHPMLDYKMKKPHTKINFFLLIFLKSCTHNDKILTRTALTVWDILHTWIHTEYAYILHTWMQLHWLRITILHSKRCCCP